MPLCAIDNFNNGQTAINCLTCGFTQWLRSLFHFILCSFYADKYILINRFLVEYLLFSSLCDQYVKAQDPNYFQTQKRALILLFASCLSASQCFRLMMSVANIEICVWRHLAFVVADRRVHLLFSHVVYLWGGTTLDTFLFLSLEFICHHLDRLCPLIPMEAHTKPMFLSKKYDFIHQEYSWDTLNKHVVQF